MTDEMTMLRDAHWAITISGLRHWIETYDPPKDRGFMFDDHPNLDIIMAAMAYQGHSGASFAWTMRMMQAIAKSGDWDRFRQPPCPCRLKDGHAYGWCGVAGGGVPGCEH